MQAISATIPFRKPLQCLITDQTTLSTHYFEQYGISSILDLKLHKDIWPEITYDRTMTLRSTTLASLIEREQIDTSLYDALVMDTQGSELLVLRGAVPVLRTFRFIKTEVADFESYAGCCQLKDIEAFLALRGFREVSRHKFAQRAQGGGYYDVVYQRQP